MSLYHEAASFLSPGEQSRTGSVGSLKSRVFTAKNLKNAPTQIYALVVEATKWSSVLSAIIDKAALLTVEKKLTPYLALLLVHDLLLAKRGIVLPKDHGLRSCVEKHKARLNAEFTRARIKARVASIDQWKRQIALSSAMSGPKHPRWVRVNDLRKKSESSDFEHSLAAKTEVHSLEDIVLADSIDPICKFDWHVNNLIALPAGADVMNTSAYKTGRIILQDKASCFPACLLSPVVGYGDIIDACAAPGNKTTHLADLARQQAPNHNVDEPKIYAVERDALRAETLQKMVRIAGADRMVECLVKQDFLKLRPEDERFRNVGVIMLDPSCSGSGIVGRDEETDLRLPKLILPGNVDGDIGAAQPKSKSSARRRSERLQKKPSDDQTARAVSIDAATDEQDQAVPEGPDLGKRLESLSRFQTTMVLHALKFPSVRKIGYSTCSVHAQENEQVVINVLTSTQARAGGWRILRREEQVPGMLDWERRADVRVVEDAFAAAGQEYGTEAALKEIAEGCIRCSKGTNEGTMGFFAAVFVRDSLENEGKKDTTTREDDGIEESGSDWKGFSDAD